MKARIPSDYGESELAKPRWWVSDQTELCRHGLLVPAWLYADLTEEVRA